MKEYSKVPNIITGKDLDYLQDMFNWNLLAYKNTMDAICMLEDESLKEHLYNCSDTFYNALVDVLNVIEEGSHEDSK